MVTEAGGPSFVEAFAEWVEACWFAEREAADARLEAVLRFPADQVLTGSLAVLARLLPTFAPAGETEVAGALVEHLLITGPDPKREALIRDVVLGAGSGAGRGPGALVARHGTEAVTGTALECASVLAQAMANRQGVVPSSILLDL
jgi:hypothetical protein